MAAWKDVLLAKTLVRLSGTQRDQFLQAVLEHSRTVADPSETLKTALHHLEAVQNATVSATETIAALRRVLSAMPNDSRKVFLRRIDTGLLRARR